MWLAPITSTRLAIWIQAFLNKLHDGGQKWVPIIDPGILIDPGYPAYDEGMKEDVWVKDATGQPYAGQVTTASGAAFGDGFLCCACAIVRVDQMPMWQ